MRELTNEEKQWLWRDEPFLKITDGFAVSEAKLIELLDAKKALEVAVMALESITDNEDGCSEFVAKKAIDRINDIIGKD